MAVRKPASAAPLGLRELQLATLVAAPPEGDQWLHEQKFDGYRILAVRDGRRVQLLSRRFKDWTDAFPVVADAVAALPVDRVVLDGEVAAVLSDGRTSFQALQNADRDTALAYFAFDLLSLDGEDLARRPLEHRKAALAALVANSEVIRYSDHVIGRGAEFFALACKRGLEGIISKQRDQPYSPGRGPGWRKTKCLLRQELVIGGYTEPSGSRVGIGALLVGYYDGDRLTYAGKVGTGFSHATLRELADQLGAIARPSSAFAPEPPRAWTGAGRHWVEPKLVAEIAFSEWTADGRLRHPSFQGLRADKRARDVVRERPVALPSAPSSSQAVAPAAKKKPTRRPAR